MLIFVMLTQFMDGLTALRIEVVMKTLIYRLTKGPRTLVKSN